MWCSCANLRALLPSLCRRRLNWSPKESSAWASPTYFTRSSSGAPSGKYLRRTQEMANRDNDVAVEILKQHSPRLSHLTRPLTALCCLQSRRGDNPVLPQKPLLPLTPSSKGTRCWCWCSFAYPARALFSFLSVPTSEYKKGPAKHVFVFIVDRSDRMSELVGTPPSRLYHVNICFIFSQPKMRRAHF